ncbi:hypothetical protein ACIQXU_16695 [Peribacillus sp. NPDC097284]|uniref:hypothetical protein n=1 Tax=Peribacillus sp. NPDC097284 TaxID=3364401 RepID=UPI00380E7179
MGRISHEVFVQEVFELEGDNYTVQSEYINDKTKVMIKHNVCDKVYPVRRSKFIKGQRCKKCSRVKKTHDEFIQEVKDLIGNEYIVLGNYVNEKTKVLIKHNVCNTEREYRPWAFLNQRKKGASCKNCYCTADKPSRKLTHEKFVQQVKDVIGDEYTVIGTFIDRKTEVLIRHNVCNFERRYHPRGFLEQRKKGATCTNCFLTGENKPSNSVKLTHEEFVKRVKFIVGDEYTILDTYKNMETRLSIRHNLCRKVIQLNPHSFLESKKSGHRCKQCTKNEPRLNLRTTHDDYVRAVYELVGEEYTVVGTYIKSDEKLVVRHNECGNMYEVQPNNFLSGKRCRPCRLIENAERKRKTHQEFEAEVKERHGERYSVIGKYVKNKDKIEMKCNICLDHFQTLPSTVLTSDGGCMKCARKKRADILRKDIDVFKEEVKAIVGEEYTVIGEYQTTRKPIEMRHNICGSLWSVSPAQFLNKGTRCIVCGESHGESKVRKWLGENNFYFKSQYSFDNLIGIGNGQLRFDFAIIDENENLLMLIEYDGEYHFEKQYEGDNHEKIVLHDQMKNEYCKIKGIKLLRIPFWEFENVESILKNQLSRLLV